MTHDPYVGALIRTRRLERNYSQEGLCRGVCAVSYLSKIENGTVTPSEEILQKLFAALDLTYTTDERTLSLLRTDIDAFFCACWEDRDASEIRRRIEIAHEALLCSPLHLHGLLFDAMCAYTDEDLSAARALLARLSAHQAQMDMDSLVRFHLLCGLCDADDARSLAALARADALQPAPVTAHFLCVAHYRQGRYHDALRFARQSYDRAARAGSVYFMKYAALYEGTCYSNLYEYPLMRDAFDRVRALAPDDAALMQQVDYNLGASYVSTGDAQQALPYLTRALAADTLPFSRFFTLHKLALAQQLLGHTAEGLDAIAQAEAILDADASLPAVYRDMLRLIALRFEPGYARTDEYLALARTLYRTLGPQIHHGFALFHAPLLIEALCAHRLYKEALSVALDARCHFPDSLRQSLLSTDAKD